MPWQRTRSEPAPVPWQPAHLTQQLHAVGPDQLLDLVQQVPHPRLLRAAPHRWGGVANAPAHRAPLSAAAPRPCNTHMHTHTMHPGPGSACLHEAVCARLLGHIAKGVQADQTTAALEGQEAARGRERAGQVRGQPADAKYQLLVSAGSAATALAGPGALLAAPTCSIRLLMDCSVKAQPSSLMGLMSIWQQGGRQGQATKSAPTQQWGRTPPPPPPGARPCMPPWRATGMPMVPACHAPAGCRTCTTGAPGCHPPGGPPAAAARACACAPWPADRHPGPLCSREQAGAARWVGRGCEQALCESEDWVGCKARLRHAPAGAGRAAGSAAAPAAGGASFIPPFPQMSCHFTNMGANLDCSPCCR